LLPVRFRSALCSMRICATCTLFMLHAQMSVSIFTFVLVLRQCLYFVLVTQVNRHVCDEHLRDMHGVDVARPGERCFSICTCVLVKHVNLRSALCSVQHARSSCYRFCVSICTFALVKRVNRAPARPDERGPPVL
jgi:hypothetical protein